MGLAGNTAVQTDSDNFFFPSERILLENYAIYIFFWK